MYECKKCNYVTLKKSDWNKHIITKKHKKMAMLTSNFDNNTIIRVKSVIKTNNKTTEKKFVCENCGHRYKFRSGLSRHEMKCYKEKPTDNNIVEEESIEQEMTESKKVDELETTEEERIKIETVEKEVVISETTMTNLMEQANKKIEEKLREKLKNELKEEQEQERKRHDQEIKRNQEALNEVYNKLSSDSKALNEAFKTTLMETIESQVIKKQQEQITDLQSMLQQSIENTKETVSEMLPRIGNTTNITNTQMTVNIFLNEECKNALNLNDFLRTLDLSVDDLLYTSQNGYSKGIANIFVKKLQDLEPTERPIHCSDKDELQFYIKDQNVWEKDNENMKIDRSIEHITQKQIQKIKEWESGNPTWQHTDKDAEFYMNLIKESVGGLNELDKKDNFEKIKKELGINIDISDFIGDNDKIDNK